MKPCQSRRTVQQHCRGWVTFCCLMWITDIRNKRQACWRTQEWVGGWDGGEGGAACVALSYVPLSCGSPTPPQPQPPGSHHCSRECSAYNYPQSTLKKHSFTVINSRHFKGSMWHHHTPRNQRVLLQIMITVERRLCTHATTRVGSVSEDREKVTVCFLALFMSDATRAKESEVASVQFKTTFCIM